MNTRNNNVLLAVITGALLAIPSVLALALGWPGWLWLVVVIALLVVPIVVAVRFRERASHQQRMREFQAQQQAAVHPEPELKAEPEPHRSTLAEVSLPSAEPDYRFRFSATVCWRRTLNGVGVPYTNPQAVAEDLVVTRARESVASEPPDSVDLARHRISAGLSGWLCDRSGHVEFCAEDVALTLAEEDSRRIRRRCEVRKDEELWQQERDYERRRRAYLRDEVFQDTASALMWLVAQQVQDREASAESVRVAVDLLSKLSRISSVVNGKTAVVAAYSASEDVVLPPRNGAHS